MQQHQVRLNGTVLATLIGRPSDAVVAPLPGAELVMSRFAWVRRDGSALVAETSRSPWVVVLEDPRAAALLQALAAPVGLDGELASGAGLPLPSALEVAGLLRAALLVIDAGAAGAEDEPPFATWEFHDLMFHSRSRRGRHRGRSGATHRFAGRLPPPPALAPARWPNAVALPVPDWDRLEREDPPLAAVQSRRMTRRQYGREALRLEQLGEFLYRVGRIEDRWQAGEESFVAKPYPSGGSLHELELYAAIRACRGIEPGLYHYGAERHVLERVAGETAEVSALIDEGGAAMGVDGPMQVLVVAAARVNRVAFKYEGIAYALVLKDVGVALETMYLAATAMGLAACALGVGDSDRFARASGLDYYEQTAVGEFALGSRPG
jgi:oxazoline/thiazoline dehydrogenase